jgi:molybdopterin adenylyltransferase
MAGFRLMTWKDLLAINLPRSLCSLGCKDKSSDYFKLLDIESLALRLFLTNRLRFKQNLDRAVASASRIQAIVFNGGTGLSTRDTTYDAIANKSTKTLPSFGEIFRLLSYQEITSRAIGSRAITGTYQHLLIFSLLVSSGAVRLGMEKSILPELVHLVTQIQQ